MSEGKFCILPWMHTHILPNGDVIPCCAVKVGSMSMGNVHESPLEEIWNGEAYRQMRLDMLAGRSIPSCSVCYIAEKNGGTSLRTKTDGEFAHHKKLTEKTKPDGSLPDFRFYYYDVRFSNLCNLRCRMCCPELSSAIAQDQAFQNELPKPKPLNIYEDKESFLKDFIPHIPHLEEIYFAGGEPLLIDAHYWALEEIIKSGRKDIRIRYNTNFTILGKGKYYAPELWKNFDYVEIGASLDAEGERAEYIRQGTDWNKILENREQLRRDAPHVDFKIFLTVGMMNFLHVPDFIKNAINTGFVLPDKIVTTNLISPEFLSAQVLPEKWKKEARLKYLSLEGFLKGKGTPDWALSNLNALVSFMDSSNQRHLLRDFFRETSRMDDFFGKKFNEVFPEFTGLENFIDS